MGWQKTFTLSKRAKGCHLVTDEVSAQIQPGLQDVQARGPVLRASFLTSNQTAIWAVGWNVVSVHVRVCLDWIIMLTM
jgi:hypothetical protein